MEEIRGRFRVVAAPFGHVGTKPHRAWFRQQLDLGIEPGRAGQLGSARGRSSSSSPRSTTWSGS
jgi:hypothetical protein